MRDDWVAAFAVVSLLGPVACGQPAQGSGSAGTSGSGAVAAAAPGTGQSGMAGPAETPQQELPLLAPDERRVALFVLPGDAVVEVDGQPVQRRNGVVELVGKLEAVRYVRVRKGDRSTEAKAVTIKEAGASPSLIDLNEPLSPGAVGAATVKPQAIDIDD